MKRIAASRVMLTLLIMGILTSAFNIQRVEAQDQPLFKVTIIAPGNANLLRRQWGQMFADSLQRLGIDANVVFLGWAEVYDRVFTPPHENVGKIYDDGGFDIQLVGWTPGLIPQPRQIFYASPEFFAPLGNNYYLWNNTQSNTLLDTFITSTNAIERELALQEWQSLFFNEVPCSQIFYSSSLAVVTPELGGPALGGTITGAGPGWFYFNAQPNPELLTGRTSVVYASTGEIESLIPTLSNSWYDTIINAVMFNGLSQVATDLSDLSIPALLKSWMPSNNGFKWTFNCRTGVKWHDGADFTADDVVFSLWALMNPATYSQHTRTYQRAYGDNVKFTYANGSSTTLGTGTRVGNITAVNATTVEVWLPEFALGEPYGYFDPFLLGFANNIIPKHIFEKIPPVYWTASPFNTGEGTIVVPGTPGTIAPETYDGPVGTGPYKWVDYDAVAQLVTLEKFANYWNRTALESDGLFGVQDYYIRFIADKTPALAALKNDEVDMLDPNYQIQADIPTIDPAWGKVLLLEGIGRQEAGYNNRHPVFGTGVDTPLGQSDPSRAAEAARYVRTAFDYAIPRQEIIDNLLAGYAQPGATPILPTQPYYNSSITPRSYDLWKAKEYLEKAGYTVCTHELTVSLDTPAFLEPGDSSLLNATVYNRGLSNETNVELQMMINGIVVDSVVISELLAGSSNTLNYLWTPTVEGIYNVTAYSPPVPGENVTTNNLVSRIVHVYYITVALVSDHSELLAITGILDSMGIGYDAYNDNNMYFYTEDLNLLLDYPAVIFYTDYRHITSNEYNALESYLSSGGSLLVTGFDSLVSDDLLRDIIRSATMGDNVGEPDLYVVDGTHPIMDGTFGSFSAGYHISGLYSDCDATEADTAQNAVTVAELADGYDKIIATDGLPGKVVYWNGIGPDDWMWNSDCEVMFKNTLAWFTIQYEHELTVSLETPTFLEPSDSALLNATVRNRGLSNETGVELFLLINGTEVNHVTISELVNGTSYTIDYLWTPTVEGIYNITAYAPPVPDENVTTNNWDTEFTMVRYAVMIGIIETHGENMYTEELVNYYTSLGHVVETITTTITPEVLSSYDIVIIGEGGGTWLPSEIASVQAYIDSGRGFVAIGDQLSPSILEILGTYGISYAGISAPGGSSSYFDSLHPIMQGVSLIYAGSPVNSLQIATPAYWIANDVSDTYILIAGAEVGGYVICLCNDFASYLHNDDNEVMFKNIVDWMAVKYEHELTVSLDAPAFLEPGDSALLNATVHNWGLSNETGVELFLLINGTEVNHVTISELVNGTSYTIDYLWTPTIEGIYNVTAYALPVPGENVTTNNLVSRIVQVRATVGISIFPSKRIYKSYSECYYINTEFTVKVYITNITDCAGYQFKIDYNASVLEYVGSTFDTDPPNPLSPTQMAPDPDYRFDTDLSVPGSVRLATVWKYPGPPSYSYAGDSVAAELTFKIIYCPPKLVGDPPQDNTVWSDISFDQAMTLATDFFGDDILFFTFKDGYYEYTTLGGLPTLTIHSSPSGVAFTADGVPHTTPWSGDYIEGTSVNLEMPQTHNGYVWDCWSDGDTNRMKTVVMNTNITLTGQYAQIPKPVGGKATPINKITTMPVNHLELLDPYIGITLLLAVAAVTVVYVKKRKRNTV